MTRLRITRPYVHRSGRTARAGQGGVVVSLVQPDQVKGLRRLQRQIGLNEPFTAPTPTRCGISPTYPPRPILPQPPRRTKHDLVRLGTHPALPRRPTKITAAAPHQADTRLDRRPSTVRKRARRMAVADHGAGTRPTGPHARAVVRRTSGPVGRISYPALLNSSAVANRQS